MNVTVEWEDGGLRKLRSNLDELREMKVLVGYQPPEGGKRYETGITVAKLAAVHEFGSPDRDPPARSFIRSTIRERAGEISLFEERTVVDVAHGRVKPVDAMSSIGKLVCGLIREKLEGAASWAKPLDPETVERKGDSTPLEETRLLISSLSWRVVRGRTEVARGT